MKTPRPPAHHAAALLWFAVLAVATSWPLPRHFTTALTIAGSDGRSYLWQLWHVKEAALGREPLLWTPLLFYPAGASMLTHGTGPVLGVLALPWWWLGPEAAYNGALLIDLWLTGYAMYLLARSMGLDHGVALFSGTVLAMADMHLAGLLGHKEKTCLIFLPLVILAAIRALDGGRSRLYGPAAGALLLVTLLTSGWQFILASVALAMLAAATLVRGWRTGGMRSAAGRVTLLAVSVVVAVLPLLIAIRAAANQPGILTNVSTESARHRSDLVQFALPSVRSGLLGPVSRRVHDALGIRPGIETTVALSWTATLLTLLAVRRRVAEAVVWMAMLLVCVVLSLGPFLQVLGQERFLDLGPLPLPFAMLTSLPGFGFMRTPGRFMLLGFVALALSAGLGLQAMVRDRPDRRTSILVAAFALLLAETWPVTWPSERLREAPAFYQRLAADGDAYGVFDLPLKASPQGSYVTYSSHYQVFQMTHRKGIAAGYLSRTYVPHPVFPCLFGAATETAQLRLDGAPADCAAQTLPMLRLNGYRYVVWHMPQPDGRDYVGGSWAWKESERFVEEALRGAPPVFADDRARVYPVPAATSARDVVTMFLGSNWHPPDESGRWARSPATLVLQTGLPLRGSLEILPSLMHDPSEPNGAGHQGVLAVAAGESITQVRLRASERASVPLVLAPGRHTLTLSLQAGNFRPSALGSPDQRELSFAVRWIDLRTQEGPAVPFPVGGSPSSPRPAPGVAPGPRSPGKP